MARAKSSGLVAVECPWATQMRFVGGDIRVRRIIVNSPPIGDEIEAVGDRLHVLELAVARLGDEGGIDEQTPTALRTFVMELGDRVMALTAEPVGDEDDEREAAE